ncbi:MAG: hypothetical protein E7D13_09515 [Finegoldia magna]|nr:hypothetical protein [Finegoldia magna]
MKKIGYFLFAIIISLLMVSCAQSDKSRVSDELNLKLVKSNQIMEYEDHGAMGDGTRFKTFEFDSNDTLNQIKSDSNWKKFPLDKTTKTLMYGDEKTSSYVTDHNSRSLFPEISEGYYLLIDRQEDKSQNILNRPSSNFTLAVYDTKTNTLYFAEIDT